MSPLALYVVSVSEVGVCHTGDAIERNGVAADRHHRIPGSNGNRDVGVECNDIPVAVSDTATG